LGLSWPGKKDSRVDFPFESAVWETLYEVQTSFKTGNQLGYVSFSANSNANGIKHASCNCNHPATATILQLQPSCNCNHPATATILQLQTHAYRHIHIDLGVLTLTETRIRDHPLPYSSIASIQLRYAAHTGLRNLAL
jgi:hypothetical protein